jgi:type VI secretion system secreted protein Hcp
MKVLGSTLIGIALLLMVVVPSAALAADNLFLKLEGIEGEATDDKHLREIVLLSYSQSFGRPGVNPSAGGGAAPAIPECGSVTVTKLVDTSSPALIGAVMTGRFIQTGVITFRKAAGEAPLDYYKVTLTNVLIHSITQTDVSPTDPTTILEQISMSADTFTFEYTPQRADGTLGGVVSFGWDCKSQRRR